MSSERLGAVVLALVFLVSAVLACGPAADGGGPSVVSAPAAGNRWVRPFMFDEAQRSRRVAKLTRCSLHRPMDPSLRRR